MKLTLSMLACTAAVLSLSAPLAQAEEASCKAVRFADVGWSDIAATTGMASVVLEGLGYKPTVTIASVPITFAGIKSKQIDAFLGYWNPSMTPMIEPFVKAGQIKVLDQPNLVGAKYTLAVPAYLYDKGLKTFADISKFQKELDGKIYGIEPGNDGNALIIDMIKKNDFNLKGFKIVESSEAGMLAEVMRSTRSSKPIVFLGWEPHPMNVQVKMKYLEGGDAVFGPNLGEAKVFTAIPPAYETRCPNVATLLKNLQFNTDMENSVMLSIMGKAKPNAAAKDYLKKNPAVLEGWLKGVKTFDGKDGLPAVVASLK
ncbi:choline ABC transporter substrate-binding protein [Rhodoferax saidenbachensis]|uniref:Glycine betaine/proline transport system substrate-binding protein n=1 Tax=Rhodoferax saidenbachensis TaxID=1484693 RepID=A0ABU1ZMT2_9BURK|nr:glycine betaine/proline transport system substrate-binding protein [Rhodoferax saidenbachensis]